MNGLTEERRRRLPGYVLNYIDRLERERDDLRAELEQRKKVNTNVWQRASVIHGVPDMPLQEDAEVRFDVTGDNDPDEAFRRQQFIDVRHDHSDPKVLAIRGARPLVLQPWASNVLYVRIDPR